jgi:hypothetical protein
LHSALSAPRRTTWHRGCPSLLDLDCLGRTSGRALNRTGPPRRRRNSRTRNTRHRLGRTRRRSGARPRDLRGGPGRVDCARVPYVGSPCSGIDRARVANVRGRGTGIHAQRLGSRVMACPHHQERRQGERRTSEPIRTHPAIPRRWSGNACRRRPGKTRAGCLRD